MVRGQCQLSRIASEDCDPVGCGIGAIGDVLQDVTCVIEAIGGGASALAVDSAASRLGADFFESRVKVGGCGGECTNLIRHDVVHLNEKSRLIE